MQWLRPRTPRTRGAVLTELVLGLPILLFFLLLAFEVARFAMIQGQVVSVTHDAARRAAAVGIAGEGGSCADTGGAGNYALEEYCNGVGTVVTGTASLYDTAQLTVELPTPHAGDRYCREGNDRVQISSDAEMEFIMPLLGELLTLVGGTGQELDMGDVAVGATAVSACEVAR